MDFKLQVKFFYDNEHGREEYELLEMPGFYDVELTVISDNIQSEILFKVCKISNISKDILKSSIINFLNIIINERNWDDINIKFDLSKLKQEYFTSRERDEYLRTCSFTYNYSQINNIQFIEYKNALNDDMIYSINDSCNNLSKKSMQEKMKFDVMALLNYLTVKELDIVKKLKFL